jgi:predicted TIM-barrel fold metal-dependent hydrolase
VPWFRIWGDEGDDGVRALEEGVKEMGCRGFEVSSYREKRYINDRAFYPYYAKCVELNIPVRITTGIHLLSDRAHDYAHPKHLDQVARDFPDLTIVAGLAGWPWVADLVAIATRHKNIYIDFACRRVKHLIAPGSGYEMLIYYGNRILQDKILFASGWGTMQVPLAQLIAECDELPLKDSVRQKWMHDNAAKVLRL